MIKTIIITGASDGIGAAAARRLSDHGHRVVVVGRSKSKTADIAHHIGAQYYLADFADLSQVRHLAEELLATYPLIDVLANNAGGIMGARTVTIDGNEMTFQVNHLAPFLLTTLLLPSLVAGQATVIQTASVAARFFGKFNIDDLQNARDYAPQTAYGNAKLANILFTKELQRRYADQGIAAVSFHPGLVGTSFASDTTHPMRRLYHGPLKRLLTITPDKGADQLVWLAEGVARSTFEAGEYYESKKVAKKINADMNDANLARQLWERSEELV
ncbi:NAD(P)-dependent dehydrogenase (short-subunit alcohol dehydrogenase family) [Cryobacterium sp. CAN_C3]|uniref:SDR family NAD(P)-dependent oxidoreductase n=1 Tax=unclassified Cryobacterium TaxID=2649013 RepID=UPI0018CB4A9C|nr:SDR family NAD(P)-dependent oxidoreductase [Cryobacterium sp. CAN_C3]MEC5154296.1 NAD(P)-dependent dehydrogenase (short-subunit alcohol dehydrogenase family) [Cryobacterium sp. CAN_C3]